MKIADINFENGSITLLNNQKGNNSIRFLRNVIQSYVDAYFIVAQTILYMQNLGGSRNSGSVPIEQTQLCGQLHISIRNLHQKGIIKEMSSCLVEVL